ncbi:glycosyltransferase family 4 protein [Ramlibacter sp. PS3R-8]|uniref:glycosyltransferase family 4 protein n=1 Tax=Ramlibacter sp. PS3R-8 TaxID=3133437 RepID=UPI0030A563D2
MSRPLRVLFVAHDAYRAGGTLFLLNMLRWLRAHTELQFDVALPCEGEMVAEFEPVCRAFVLQPLPAADGGACDRLQAWLKRARSLGRYRSLQSLLDGGGYDLLYLNTITLGKQLARLQRLALPVVTHVHELEWAIRRYAHGHEQRVLECSDRVICVSDAVLDNLVRSHGCPPHKARRVHGFVPVDVTPAGTPLERRRRLLEPLGIPLDAHVVGMCGHGDLRKGVDLAVPVARLLPTHVGGREVHMVWVGAEAPEYPHALALQDALAAGVKSRIHFVGVTRAPADWLSIFDLHLLLSREDPFPLVVMEAAVHGVPTLAFRDAGGAAEFIGADAGACTAYLDLPALAAMAQELLADSERRGALGAVAQARVRQLHAPAVILPQIVRIIEEACAARSPLSQRPRVA